MLNNIESVGAMCTGCGACSASCPSRAISISKDEWGFARPRIDAALCVDCGRCSEICPAKNPERDKKKRLEAVYGAHRDDGVRAASSSGGAFTALAQMTFDDGGAVCSHIYDRTDSRVRCVCGDSAGAISAMRQSKYVESYMDNMYEEIKKRLDCGRHVLFCGTPCQCAGVVGFFCDNENLLTVSILCHGVSSPWAFGAYLDEIGRGNRPIDVRMRYKKTLGWHDCCIKIDFERRKPYINHYTTDPYYYGDMRGDFLRDSCYACRFCDRHTSDITIGDFWNLPRVSPKKDDNGGMSLVIANTDKGCEALSRLGQYMWLEPLKLADTGYAFYPMCGNPEAEIANRVESRRDFLVRARRDGFIRTAYGTYMNRMALRRLKVAVKKTMKAVGIKR